MDELSDDALFRVFQCLPHKSLGVASCACTRWRRIAEDDRIWEGVCTLLWPSSASLFESLQPKRDYVEDASPCSPCQRPSDVHGGGVGGMEGRDTSHTEEASRPTLQCGTHTAENVETPRAEERQNSAPAPAHSSFRSFAYRRFRKTQLQIPERHISSNDLRFLLDLSFEGCSILSLSLGFQDLVLSEAAEEGDFDFVIRSLPNSCVLPYRPAPETRVFLRDQPSVYARGIHLDLDVLRLNDSKMVQLLGSTPAYQADDLNTVAFCRVLPALPFASELLAEVNLEYRVVQHFRDILLPATSSPLTTTSSSSLASSISKAPQEPALGAGEVAEIREKLLRWEFRLCRVTVKRSATFRMAACHNLMRYLAYLNWE